MAALRGLGRERPRPASSGFLDWRHERSIHRRRRPLADRQAERLALQDPRGRPCGAGAEPPRGAPRARSCGDSGRPDGLRLAGRRAGLEHRPDGAAGRWVAGVGLRLDGRPAVRIAERWGLSREELDAYSYESHRRALAAIEEGRFDNEVVAIEIFNPRVGMLFEVDETPRADTSLEALAALEPAFVEGGVVTAGNSSQICDGAAALLIASEAACGRLGLEPRARFVSFGLAGVDPRLMLHGNPQASARALERAGLGWGDISAIEVNEAFASVALQFLRDAGLDERADDVNPNGGGISLGHPLGATGARITATLLNELERRDARYGLATMCIGFGQAIAAVIERA